MAKRRIQNLLFVPISLLLLSGGIAGLIRAPLCSKNSIRWKTSEGRIFVADILDSTAAGAGIRAGDALLEMDDEPVTRGTDVDFLFESRESGRTIPLLVERGDAEYRLSLVLVPKFKNWFILLNGLLGVLFWAVGFFVFLKKPEVRAARIFGWGTVAIAFTILMVRPGFPYSGHTAEFLLPVVFHLTYPLIPAFILAFFLLYPDEKSVTRKYRLLPAALFLPALIFAALFTATYLPAIRDRSLESFAKYGKIYNFFRAYFILYVSIAIGSLIHSYRCSESRESRRRIQWILWGLSFGMAPFLFLWYLPISLGLKPLIPEEMNYLFLLFTPPAFLFSILKYHALDIEVILNRSIVYAILTGLIVSVYLILTGLAGHKLWMAARKPGEWFTIGFTLAAAVLFNPLRRRVQTFVDRHFYKIRYNYRMAIMEFSNAVTSAGSREGLIGMFMDRVHSAVPTDKMALFLSQPPGHVFEVAGCRGIHPDESKAVEKDCEIELAQIAKRRKATLAKMNRAEMKGIDVLPPGSCMDKLGIELLIPALLQKRVAGFLGMGRKLSGDRFFSEDLGLLIPMAEQAVAALERFRLQEAVLIEKAEKTKLEDLNRLKTEFLSHVSHELRSPLTAITWSTGNLLDGIPEKSSPVVRQVIAQIDECGRRLDRMIGNLLDITKIEADRIEIQPDPLNVSDEIQGALSVLRPLAEEKKVRFQVKAPPDLKVLADHDAFRTILTNLIENAVKYSPPGSPVGIEAAAPDKANAGMIEFSIRDRGSGIPKEKQNVIFEKFERLKSGSSAKEKGLGLGLYIVRKLIELQSGRIRVESEPGKGSVFHFKLPVSETVRRQPGG
ncbi:hypothetical protein JW906_11910 [bacterium]|nr:hypothetical protein [bacterium]